ncbi:metal-dependent hydrolase family protein [Pediococcus damnosus]|uniref:metal-dependent hydrolase family protein n=1 Tax=Pediococcus damnosus TaxID=51663 RepID=UPI000C1C994A|nr:amidohydrolase family protein [Pediococcus damnosus]PIO84603.1 amidohydrolase [Pediococcus damnosus]
MTVFYNANIFNGKDTEVMQNQWFEVADGKFKQIGVGNVPASIDEKKVNLQGKFVMPGLINAHTHMMMNPVTNKLEYLTEAEVTVTALKNLRDLIGSGVTYIRDCGCAFNVDIKLKKLRDQLDLVIPEIVASGRPMSMTGGHGDFREDEDGNINWSYLVDSPDEMRKSVRTAFKEGADNIKVMATGGVMSAGDNVNDTALTMAEMKVAVEEAHDKSKRVAAHAQGNKGIGNALKAGVDSIEHGIYVDEKQAEFMKENNVYLVPTLNAAASISKYGRDSLPAHMTRKNDLVKHDFFEHVAMAIQKGVKVVVGTDAGTPFNSFKTGTWEEMELLVNKAGATPTQALFGATKYAAELLNIAEGYGSIESGKFADFLVLDQDPTQYITAVAQTDKQVFKKGVQIK